MLRFPVLFPLVCSLVAFVLAMLVMFAGRQKGFMEDYAIVRLNMSNFGHDLVPTSTEDPNPEETGGSGIGDFFGDVADDVRDKVSDGLNDIGNDIADKLAGELGISQWYSLHLTDACEGMYKPNATAPGAGLNVTNCTAPSAGYQFNLSQILDHQLEVGPIDISLADLKYPDGIQRQINKINRLLLAVFVLYAIGAGLSGVAIFTNLAAFFLAIKRMISLGNLVVALLAAFSLMIGSIITTVAANEGASTISDIGENVGVEAEAGRKFIVLSWVSFAMMGAATTYWAGEFCLERRARKRFYAEKQ